MNARRWRQIVGSTTGKLMLPVLLAPVLVFGGASAEGFLAHAVILTAAGLVAASCVAFWDTSREHAGLVGPIGFLLAYLVLGGLHLFPFPTDIILSLPGRDVVDEGWSLLGVSPERTPLSLAPEMTVRALGYVFLPLAAFLLVFRLGWRRSTAVLSWGLLGLAAATCVLGFAQILNKNGSALYMYEVANFGAPVGVFANANHQASFLLMTLPFTAALLGDIRSKGVNTDGRTAYIILLLAFALLQVAGIVAAGSTAGVLLLAPVLLLSLSIMGRRDRRIPAPVLISGIAILAVVISVFVTGSILQDLSGAALAEREMSRQHMAQIIFTALEDHIWLGSGLGTFQPVFKLYEDPSTVTYVFANQAHNEYLQWALETGLPGLVLLAAFLVWWIGRMIWVWGKVKDETARTRRAAAAATLVIFLHSFVDYPARTPAILTFGAICLALMMVTRKQRSEQEPAVDEAQRVKL